MVYPLTADVAQPILFVTTCEQSTALQQVFDSVSDLGTMEVDTGPTSSRSYRTFLLSGPHRPLGSPPGCG
jgi:hypothetical protein